MPITALIELLAAPGRRDELLDAHHKLVHAHNDHPGLLGMETYKMQDNPDGLIEIAHWRSVEDHQSWRQGVIATGDAEPLLSLLATPIKTTYLEPCD